MFARVGEGKIVLRKPHPVPKIEQSSLQSWGRRIYKVGSIREGDDCV